MNRGDFEALNEIHRWLQSGGKDRWEIENASTMPAFLRREMALMDKNQGYYPSDDQLLAEKNQSPDYGGAGGPAPARRLSSEAAARQIFQTLANNASLDGPSPWDRPTAPARRIGSPRFSGVPGTSKYDNPSYGGPSKKAGNAYALISGSLMGTPTSKTDPWETPAFANMPALSDTSPETAAFIQKLVKGVMKVGGGNIGRLAARLMDQAEKEKAIQAWLDQSNEVMANQGALTGLESGGASYGGGQVFSPDPYGNPGY